MATIKSTYLGNIRTEAEHVRSGKHIITDAPVDNNGKGEFFSPTDLVAAALGSCMVTIMGIVANREKVSLDGLSWEVTKIMNDQPRKIKEIIIDFHWEQPNGDNKILQKLKNAARTCPVALSLSEDVKQTVNFNF
ncbi:OsmC family protein [Echinicola marina]|uniref:OsmC family protein n=1 Tax=Echinicola marina TaxID=2859768 RepID=UPI001CF6C7C2|nr:OsmC family protein [Echinicola marina]UCS94085.1 OsmC family protein [Echinicola marina]